MSISTDWYHYFTAMKRDDRPNVEYSQSIHVEKRKTFCEEFFVPLSPQELRQPAQNWQKTSIGRRVISDEHKASAYVLDEPDTSQPLGMLGGKVTVEKKEDGSFMDYVQRIVAHEMKNSYEPKINSLQAELGQAKAEMKNSYEPKINSLEAELGRAKDSLQAELGKAKAEMKNSYEPQINSLQAELGRAKDSLQAELGKAKAEMKNSYEPKMDGLLAASAPLALRSLIDDIVCSKDRDAKSGDRKELVLAECGMLFAEAGIGGSEIVKFFGDVMVCAGSRAHSVSFETAKLQIEAALRTPESGLSVEVLITGWKLLHSHSGPGKVISARYVDWVRNAEDKANDLKDRFNKELDKKAKAKEYEKQVDMMEEEAGVENPFD